MQQTEKYKFNLIEGSDDVSPVPLNENMEKVEAQFGAVGGLITGLTASLGSGGHNARIAFGSYVGTGNYGSGSPNSLTFDFCPVVVFVGSPKGANSASWPTVFLRGANASHYEGGHEKIEVSWTSHGLSWYNDSYANHQNNYQGTQYFYVALGYSAA